MMRGIALRLIWVGHVNDYSKSTNPEYNSWKDLTYRVNYSCLLVSGGPQITHLHSSSGAHTETAILGPTVSSEFQVSQFLGREGRWFIFHFQMVRSCSSSQQPMSTWKSESVDCVSLFLGPWLCSALRESPSWNTLVGHSAMITLFSLSSLIIFSGERTPGFIVQWNETWRPQLHTEDHIQGRGCKKSCIPKEKTRRFPW